MKQITKWMPDTCGCTLFFEWDSDEPNETRTHTPVDVTADGSQRTIRCERHKGIKDLDELHEVVIAENVAKNLAASGA